MAENTTNNNPTQFGDNISTIIQKLTDLLDIQMVNIETMEVNLKDGRNLSIVNVNDGIEIKIRKSRPKAPGK